MCTPPMGQAHTAIPALVGRHSQASPHVQEGARLTPHIPLQEGPSLCLYSRSKRGASPRLVSRSKVGADLMSNLPFQKGASPYPPPSSMRNQDRASSTTRRGVKPMPPHRAKPPASRGGSSHASSTHPGRSQAHVLSTPQKLGLNQRLIYHSSRGWVHASLQGQVHTSFPNPRRSQSHSLQV